MNSVAFSPDGGAIVSASSDNTARLWNASTGVRRRAGWPRRWDGCGAVRCGAARRMSHRLLYPEDREGLGGKEGCGEDGGGVSGKFLGSRALKLGIGVNRGPKLGGGGVGRRAQLTGP